MHVGDARFAQALAPVGLVPHRHHGRTGLADLAFVKDLVRLDRAVVLDQVVVVNPALPAVGTLNLCFLCSSVSDFADHKRIGAKNIHHVAFLKHWRFSWNRIQLVLLGCATLSAGRDKLVVDLLDNWVLHVGLVWLHYVWLHRVWLPGLVALPVWLIGFTAIFACKLALPICNAHCELDCWLKIHMMVLMCVVFKKMCRWSW